MVDPPLCFICFYYNASARGVLPIPLCSSARFINHFAPPAAKGAGAPVTSSLHACH
ncbi:hypothetical protein CLOHYLEM_07122 [[Clostridium] hylemonae DSM 15053]|uniref:Uncharacterized protein n=1 Tax=[Clostridium] hylemonae DSM 15053 TaxID=553973 RepID=C0C4V6_9FIRM|nr:hypothetical protein CLOHYLEM_07122 [[Clostridium] hylemonae DSM 15053]